MNWVHVIMLLLLGVLGAASLILAKRPDAKAALAKIQPYQGWIGVVGFIWGVWGVISVLLHLGLPILWIITLLAVAAVEIVLGLLLGLGVMKTFVTSPEAVRRLEASAVRLAPKQGTFGIIALIVAAWLIVKNLMG